MRRLRLSAILDRLDTEGDEFSLRGVVSGAEALEDTDEMEMGCGLMRGLSLMATGDVDDCTWPPDEPGRECASAMMRSEVRQRVNQLRLSRACRERAAFPSHSKAGLR